MKKIWHPNGMPEQLLQGYYYYKPIPAEEVETTPRECKESDKSFITEKVLKPEYS